MVNCIFASPTRLISCEETYSSRVEDIFQGKTIFFPRVKTTNPPIIGWSTPGRL